MFKCFVILVLTLTLVMGCGSVKNISSNNTTPKFEVAADKQNDPVSSVTPDIQEALIQSYLSDLKVGATRENFVKVVNSLPVEGGTEFVVRVKDGFSMFFMDNQSKKIYFTSGSVSSDVSHTPMSYSVSPIKTDSPDKVFVGFFNITNAKSVLLTWSDGTVSQYQLTNGTLMLSPFDGKITVTKYEIKNESGNTLYNGQWH
jgi:hypothetical protein